MGNNMEFLHKIKHKTTMQFSSSTAGYLPKEKENINSKKYVHPNVHSSIVDTIDMR